MHYFAHSRSIIALLLAASLPTVKTLASTQNHTPPAQSSGSSKTTSHDSAEVIATLFPQDIEEGELNDAYQQIAQEQREGTCTEKTVELYRTKVIAVAEKSASRVAKNKFLFLANRDIGNCFLTQQNFVEAESSFRKILQYVSVWPGTDDSAYPINMRQIATAQMGQQRWQAAEESLRKSVELFDPQIDKAMKSDSEFFRTEHLGNLRGSKATSLAYLAIVYFREARATDALKTADSAYAEAKQPNVPPTVASEVVKIGRSLARTSGDKEAIAKWSRL